MSKKDVEDYLHVRISKATNLVWEGEARSVSSKNADGTFDILPMHSNFITLIQEDPITVVTKEGKEEVYDFKKSVVFVNSNEVKIFSDLT